MFRVMIATLISIPIGVLDGVVPFSLRYYVNFINNITHSHSNITQTYVNIAHLNIKMILLVPIAIMVAIVGFSALQGILMYIATYTNSWVGMKITNDIKKKLFNKLLKYESSFYDKNPTGFIVSRFATDVDSASNGLIGNVKAFLQKLFSSITLIGVLIYNSWQLAIIAVCIIVLIYTSVKA